MKDTAQAKPSVAIIGGGVAGLTSAWHLHRDCRVELFEADSRLGGHTDTHTLSIDGVDQQIDSGFIVFSAQHYPYFCNMLDQLGVTTQATSMSFSAHNPNSGVMYNAATLNTLFCQRRNLLSLRFYRMLIDLVRFYRSAPKVLRAGDSSQSVKDYLGEHNYGKAFSEDHLLPMISALWSATPQRVGEFPIRHLIEFMRAHGMLNLFRRPQWAVIKGGSARYVEALQNQIACVWHTNSAVVKLRRHAEKVEIITRDGSSYEFDGVVIAIHADQALNIIEDPRPLEQSVLGAITFQPNHVVIHQDASVMPPLKSAWASWNTEVPNTQHAASQRCCTAHYWMNNLQGLNLASDVFVSLNSQGLIDPNKILAERDYAHPIFTADSVAAARQLPDLNGVNRTWYAGAYWGWGFHEDGARTAVEAARAIQEFFKTQDKHREHAA